jgi:hypothetical protein
MGGVTGDVRQVQDVVHVAGEDGPVLPVEDGQPVESFESEGTIVVFSGADWLPQGIDLGEDWAMQDDGISYYQQFDEALAGSTAVTVGTFATPKAEQVSQTLNPVARMSAGELVTTEQGQQLLRESGIVEAMDFDNPHETEFVAFARPKETFARPKETFVSVFGGETALESFVGVVRDGEVLRLALVHVARVETGDDVVFLAGAMHRKLWSSTGDGEFGTDHVDAIARDLADADVGSLLMGGEDPLVTPDGVEASIAEVEAVTPEFEQVSEE